MEPMVPDDPGQELAGLGWEVVRRAERLGSGLHSLTAAGLAGVVQVMNSFYSHLIEGHGTRPADLAAVLRGRSEGPPARRELQQLHFAHMATQLAMKKKLTANAEEPIASEAFLQELHRTFYEALPASARIITGPAAPPDEVVPGEWRRFNVSVGRHLAPAWDKLPGFMARFAKVYAPCVRDTGPGLVACAAAHHRLAWIHPWADGNGRVARLFSEAWLIRSRVDAHGLWSIPRGLARRLTEYRAHLANADHKRENDFDGRGYLSRKALRAFCRFFLETCLDQLDYMNDCLAIDRLDQRMTGFAKMKEATGDWPAGTSLVLREVCLRGEIPRGEVARLIGKSTRTAQGVISQLLTAGCLTSSSEKGPLRLGWPGEALQAWLPDVFG
jgi:Fic family protein